MIRLGCPEELPYGDDLTLVSETCKGRKGRLDAWEEALKPKELSRQK